MMDKMRMETADITAQNIEKIGTLFPNCITEMLDIEKSTAENKVYKKAINFELLKQMLSKEAIDSNEAYEFTWVGKKASIIEANKPIRKTLRPCKDESVNWDDTQNLYIEGDNLEVLKLLQESYLGKVKMIYIDPPYNTGNDFIYKDKFKMSSDEYANRSGETDEEGNRMLKNTDSNGRFHSDWCSMIYPRLLLARNLLSDDGVIFISIDDNEQANLKKICDEVFGTENFIATYKWNKTSTPPSLSKKVRLKYEYIICYEKKRNNIEYSGGTVDGGDMPLLNEGNGIRELLFDKNNVEFNFDGFLKKGTYDKTELINDIVIENGKAKTDFILKGAFKWTQETLNDEIKLGTNFVIKTKKMSPRYKRIGERDKRPSDVISKVECQVDTNEGAKKELEGIFGSNLMDYPKPTSLLKYILQFNENKSIDSIIIDFFSGSSTTAHAVMQLNAEDGGNRKFIMVQLPEVTKEDSEAYKAGYKNICEIGKERIRRAGKKILEENKDKEGIENLDIGFRVLKLDDTNMENVYYSPSEYSQDQLFKHESNVKPDRTDLDLLFGCLLEWGLPLSLPYACEKIGGCTVHNYNDGDLIACFDENIAESVIKEIAKKRPLRAVFRDSSFANSPSKINVAEIFKLLAPDTRVKVI